MDSTKELQCELRRKAYMSAFDNFIDSTTGGMKRKHNTDKKEMINNGKRGVKRKTKSSRHKNEPINLNRDEVIALKSLKDKIKQGDLIVCQTDKSSRFAALTRHQYMTSGLVHTSKDEEISWKKVRYLQSQVNNHVWWLSKIVGYANETDPARMMKNIQNHSLEVPEMALLIKDHKSHDPDSSAPVPSRPVVSGNRGVNTHLSELISEILEPLVLEMGGGEVASTEEALHSICDVNDKLTKHQNDWEKLNILNVLNNNGASDNDSTDATINESNVQASYTGPEIDSPVGMDGMNNSGDPRSPSNNNGPVGMDGMNKFEREGGGRMPSPQKVILQM